METDGTWTDTPETLAERLDRATSEMAIAPVSNHRVKSWLLLLAGPIRDRLALIQGRRWIAPEPTPAARRMTLRLQNLVRQAARRHERERLAQLELALRFVVGGHTAGEAALIERHAKLPDAELLAGLRRFPLRTTQPMTLEARLTGLVVFDPDPSSRSPP
jgi:hypothetical protein